MKWLNAVFTQMLNFLGACGVVLIFTAMVIVIINVVMRYFFQSALWWVHEVIAYILGYMTFLCAAWVLQKERHVKMDLVLSRFSQRAQDQITMVTSILCLLVCLLITWQSVFVVWDYYQIDYRYEGSLVIPVYLLEMVVPIGFAMLSIQFMKRANGCLRKLRTSS